MRSLIQGEKSDGERDPQIRRRKLDGGWRWRSCWSL